MSGETASRRGWLLCAALVGAAIVWLVGWYADTAAGIVTIWRTSETFAHGFAILPIALWLLWRRRAALAALEPRPEWRALLALAAAGFVWLLAGLAGVGVVQHFALAALLILTVWTLLGNRVTRAAAFPLAFLLLAVPAGEALQPMLMEHTATFTVWALRLTGIPVYREGLYFTIPSGNWSVVEACSGLRYLVASVTLGVLYAYLTYRSLTRRLVFVAVSFLVPIVANWLRAYMIVMIGHLTSMKYAVGVDHLIYGWLFFGVVVLLLFWVGSYWREDLDEPPPAAPRVFAAARPAPIAAASVAAAALVALWPALALTLEARTARGALTLEAPRAAASGWLTIPGRLADWGPGFQGPRAIVDSTYAKDGMRAALYIGYYRNQGPAAQLVSSQNRVLSEDGAWRALGESARTVQIGGRDLALHETRVRGPAGKLLVWHFMWIDGRFVANPYLGKVLQAKAKLFGEGDDGAVITVYARFDDRQQTAEQALRDFLAAMLPAITTTLENAKRSATDA